MIKQGDKLPDATFKVLAGDGMKDVAARDFFKGRKVVLFAVPGAFTPTCSNRHLPGFVDQAAAIKAKGVDEIACVAVNDAFVMNAWGKSASADGKVAMLADGTGEFAKKLGLEVDTGAAGMGMRSRRYAMVVEDGTVTKLFVEEAGKFEVSSAERVLSQL